MLTYLDLHPEAALLRSSISDTIESGDRVTPDLGGTGNTPGITDAIIERILAK